MVEVEDENEEVVCALCGKTVKKSEAMQWMGHDNPDWGDWHCLKCIHKGLG
jgi:hypothetical protein